MTGQERKFLAITSFPGGKRLFERMLEKTAAFSGNVSVLELELCSGV